VEEDEFAKIQDKHDNATMAINGSPVFPPHSVATLHLLSMNILARKNMKYNIRAKPAVAFGGLLVILCAASVTNRAYAQPATTAAEASAVDPAIAKIRDEGFNRSQVMQTLSYLTDVIGPRLTGSPNLKKANEWTRDTLTAYGLVNAHLESWPFGGRGWAVKRFHLQAIEPQQISLISCPRAWSPGLEKATVADVVLLEARTEADLQKYAGKLKGAIVLNGGPRPVQAHFAPQASRLADEDISQLNGARAGQRLQPGSLPAERSTMLRGGAGGGRGGPALSRGRILAFLLQEGAIMELTASAEGDGGTISGESAGVPSSGGVRGASAYSPNAPANVPQVVVAVEIYNRLARIAQQGVPIKIEAELQVEFYGDDLNAYNTVAEIPGGDLKDQIVMLGGHLDSWQMGTGATDNASGVAVCMEAARIIKTLELQPRRTVRVAFWSGEEQGLYGSMAYVSSHFASGGGRGGRGGRGGTPATRLPEYDKLSVYFNYDEGGGKIRGIYAQGNERAAALFRQWFAPLADLGASTVSMFSISDTDHISFDNAGLPGFHFIQDPLEYWSRTHHLSADVYDRIPADDLKQSAVVMATFVYNAAMADEKMPRKPGGN
jgi:carboxypeptidase Q